MKSAAASATPVFPGKIRLTILTAALAASAVAGWWLGQRGSSFRDSRFQVASSAASPSSPPSTGPLQATELQRWLAEIEKEKLPSAQTAAAARLAETLTPDQWPELLQQIGRFGSAAVRSVLEAAVVRRWAAADPEAAAEWGLKNHPGLAAAASAEWVRQDLPGALKWFDALTREQRASGWQREEFYTALLRRDPTACMDLLLAHERDPDFRMDGMERKIASLSPERALELAGRFTKEDIRKSLREAVATEKGCRDPFAAVAWAAQQPDADNIMVMIFRQYQIQPAAIIPAFASLTAEQQNHLHGETWVWWEHGDGFDTLEALRHPPEGLTEDSQKNLLSRAMSTLVRHTDLQESSRRLATQFPEFAGKWESWIAETWTGRDSEAARVWIDGLPTGEGRDKALKAYEEKKQDLAKPKTDPADGITSLMARFAGDLLNFDTILSGLTPSERQTAWQRLATLPDDQRATAQSNLITLQASINPAEAAAWLWSGEPGGQATGQPTPQHPAAPPSPELTSRLAANWALDDAPAAARWVESLPEGDSRKWALWNLSRQWQRVDASAARRWAAGRGPADQAVMESAFQNRQP